MSRPRKRATPASAPPQESETDRWLRVLPRPPRGEADDATVALWLRRVYEAGGIEGLRWAWRPQNWPLGPIWRSRVFHVFSDLEREDDERKRRAAAQPGRAHALAAAAETARREARAKAGWA